MSHGLNHCLLFLEHGFLLCARWSNEFQTTVTYQPDCWICVNQGGQEVQTCGKLKSEAKAGVKLASIVGST